jgi:hypothetical protein
MMKDKLPALPRAPLSLVVVSAIALAVGFSAAAVLGTFDVLARDIAFALTHESANSVDGEIVIVDGPPTGAGRAIQLGLLGLLFGGVPAAILAGALAARQRHRRRRWSAGRANIFLAGLVFQLSSLLVTAFLLFLLLWAAFDSVAHAQDLIEFAGPLLLSIVCSLWGLHSWRGLQFEVDQAYPEWVPTGRLTSAAADGRPAQEADSTHS